MAICCAELGLFPYTPTLYNLPHSLDCLSRLAIAVLTPGSGYEILLCRLAVPVSLGHCVTSLASSVSAYALMLTLLSQLGVLGIVNSNFKNNPKIHTYSIICHCHKV